MSQGDKKYEGFTFWQDLLCYDDEPSEENYPILCIWNEAHGEDDEAYEDIYDDILGIEGFKNEYELAFSYEGDIAEAKKHLKSLGLTEAPNPNK
jgi:hypothetical protein